ncbi:kinesin-like protein NACK1 [Papaver somniferum]|uniref:kinesin-like protein NACK1 n=1 Tax=Papaver somniferum TaxID=3469 RepID=UPI000E6F5108|nr:kinesin-like protein NACK1 [Papaver somniferum]
MKLILDEVASAMIQRYQINFTRQDVASLWFLCKQYVSVLLDSQVVVYYIKPGNLTVNDCSEDAIGSCVGGVERGDFKCNDLEQEEDIEDGSKKPKMIYLSANANLNDQVSVSDPEFRATLSETTEMINLLLMLINDDHSDELMLLRSNPYAPVSAYINNIYTMKGITESAVNDIEDHIRKGLEIYNEKVGDLFNPGSANLILQDHPKKGTSVRDLVERVAKDCNELRSLIGQCEAHRKVGETALNCQSSRSHQIVKLTIESRSRENSTHAESFVASLNLVDLAGSEFAEQAETRRVRQLKSAIRALSVGDRVKYRDSNLTRLLKPSLGGNSRSAIICTISPASSHLEQSRSTLSFGSNAKKVKNTAEVNVLTTGLELERAKKKKRTRRASFEPIIRSPAVSPENESDSEEDIWLERKRSVLARNRQFKKKKRKCKCNCFASSRCMNKRCSCFMGNDSCSTECVIDCANYSDGD